MKLIFALLLADTTNSKPVANHGAAPSYCLPMAFYKGMEDQKNNSVNDILKPVIDCQYTANPDHAKTSMNAQVFEILKQTGVSMVFNSLFLGALPDVTLEVKTSIADIARKQLNDFGVAIGMGLLACTMATEVTTQCTVIPTPTLVGTEKDLAFTMYFTSNYMKNQLDDCKTNTECHTRGAQTMVNYGKAMNTDDVFFMATFDAQEKWLLAQAEKEIPAAITAASPKAGTVGASCKAPTEGARPKCDDENCCMGFIKAEAETNYDESCQLKTATKGQASEGTVTGKLGANSFGYITITQPTFAEGDGICIEGAIGLASAALSVLATAYMMV